MDSSQERARYNANATGAFLLLIRTDLSLLFDKSSQEAREILAFGFLLRPDCLLHIGSA
ncbi:hypothetical protein [Sphingobium sp. Z007]|uniref:hypothetical protein n=1 Tax=Sphingobium sp. Z007 TaxID=627495 RepID=UPI001595009D|nr:hypothetical protein [Sphingobium sp. Z007]